MMIHSWHHLRRIGFRAFTIAGWLLVGTAAASALIVVYAHGRGLTVLSVQTGSMRPAIRPGDAVLVRRDVAIQVGDVITYRSLENPRAVITHRVVSIDRAIGQTITRGDALSSNDPAISSDRIVGRTEQVVPALGYDLDILRQPGGLMAAVYLPAVLLISDEIRRLVNHYGQSRYRLRAYPW